MLFKKNSTLLFALIMCVASFILIMCISCATPSIRTGEQHINSRLLAENSMMKRRLPLIERENDVLRKENFQHRAKIQDLETKIKKLDSELTLLGEKYVNDMAAGEEQIGNLQETIQKIVKERTKRIDALLALNTALEKKMAREVQALNEQIAVQKSAFGKERDQIVRENSERELNLSAQIADLKKNLDTKDLEISSLKIAIREISAKLGEANVLAEALRKSRDESVTELESVKAINAALTKKINALYNVLSTNNGQPKLND